MASSVLLLSVSRIECETYDSFHLRTSDILHGFQEVEVLVFFGILVLSIS